MDSGFPLRSARNDRVELIIYSEITAQHFPPEQEVP